MILINITKILLCLVSMLLTGLFALSLTAHTVINDTSGVESNDFAAAGLLLVIGITIDLSKYLFWQHRAKNKAYILISLSLMFFSWAASVSYFTTQEATKLGQMRQTTYTYLVYKAKIKAIKQEINRKDALLKKRLASRYHKQWEKSENLMAEIEALNTDLQKLIGSVNTVGVEEAQVQVNTTAFFIQLSALLQTSPDVVSSIAYGLLALLIEVCALGTLSLSQHIRWIAKNNKRDLEDKEIISKRKLKEPTTTNHTRELSNNPVLHQKNRSVDQRKQRLRVDIIEGFIQPAFTDIKRAKYHLSQASIKTVLTELHKEGRLEKEKRGFRLVKN